LRAGVVELSSGAATWVIVLIVPPGFRPGGQVA
jgi:hypothetical protein